MRGCWERVAGWIETATPLFVLLGVLVLAGLVYQVQQQAGEISQQRKDTIRVACEETNDRNRNTIHEYDVRIARALPHLRRTERAQLKQSRDFTVGLINALAPVEDCARRVQRFSTNHPNVQTRPVVAPSR